MKYNNGALQILHVRKDDSDFYVCSASSLLGRVEKKTLLVVVAWVGGILILNCSATGDPQPVISWKKQGGRLPVGRSQQINGSLVIRSLTLNDKGNYICVAPYAGVFKAETGTYTEIHKGRFLLICTELNFPFFANANRNKEIRRSSLLIGKIFF